ncbi:MAG: hypothetical protein HY964_09315 [Ignavibacteriales bacterium]|nr:hypothetical protein [Ignavibacteriales bacterium]
MKSLFNLIIAIFIIISFVLNGCELLTKPNGTQTPPPNGNDLIISEVYTIPPDKYYAYSWIEVYNPTPRNISWIQVTQPATAFSVGDAGSIGYTTDNGVTWSGIPSAISENLFDVSFPLVDSGLAVGENGKIIRINRIGESFVSNDVSSINPDPAKKNLNSIVMLENSILGYMVGDSGLILRTSNRGNTWAQYQTTRLPYNLRAINFKVFILAWAVGDSGTILKSTVQRRWDSKPPPEAFPKANFRACTFINDTGWVVGENGAIAFTKTGGNIFVDQEVPVDVAHINFNDVFFGSALGISPDLDKYDLQEGWIVGDQGTILHTTDYGTTWTQIPTSIQEDLKYIHFTNRNEGWAIGANGTILQIVSFQQPNGGYAVFIPRITRLGGYTWNAGHFNPAMVTVASEYGIEMRAKRKEYFYDPTTRTTNYNVFVKVDTGYLYLNPSALAELGVEMTPMAPGSFYIIKNDSIRFENHTKVGPGDLNQANASITYYFDTTSSTGVRKVLWDLLSSGEIRLIRYDIEYDRASSRGGDFKKFKKNIIDVVRWGDFRVADSTIYANELSQVWPKGIVYGVDYTKAPYQGANPLYNNTPLGIVPEGYSISRYANDYGTVDENKINTIGSFFMSDKPLPGWFSQRSK